MGKKYNLARVSSPTIGSGNAISLGAAVASDLSFIAAGVVDNDFLTVGIRDGNNTELAQGTVSGGVTVFNRVRTLVSTNSNNPLSLSGSANLYITNSAEDDDGYINVKSFGLKTDGTNSSVQLAPLMSSLKSFGWSSGNVCTIDIANPAVIHLPGHGLSFGNSVRFSTTGALPMGTGAVTSSVTNGVIVGVTYYVISTGLTKDQFQISTTNNFFFGQDTGGAGATGELPVVSTAGGTQSGTHTIYFGGHELIKLKFPPGNYKLNDYITSLFCGVRKLEVDFSSGAYSPNLGFNDWGNVCGPHWLDCPFALIDSYVNTNQLYVTCNPPSDAAKFFVNQYFLVIGGDMMNLYKNPGSLPACPFVFEWRKITDINYATGQLFFQYPLKRVYLSTWPTFYTGIPGNINQKAYAPGGGRATIYGFHTSWDSDRVIKGYHQSNSLPASPDYVQFNELNISIRKITFVDCVFDAPQGPIPSVQGDVYFKRCTFYGSIGPDKIIQSYSFEDCSLGGIALQSDNITQFTFDNSDTHSIYGTVRNNVIRRSRIGTLAIGPSGQGVTESVTLEDSEIGQIVPATTFQMPGGIQQSQFNACINNFAFSGGELSQPMLTTSSNFWAVPGHSYYLTDMLGSIGNIGCPFKISGLRVDGSNNFCMSTTLKSLPTGYSKNSVVTFDVSGDKVLWTGHGIAAGVEVVFMNNGGALPWGITQGVLYYVINPTANDFQIAASIGGTVIDLQSGPVGTFTGTDITSGATATTSAVTFDLTANTVFWPALPLPAANDSVTFATSVGGVLPGPLYPGSAGSGSSYYVMNISTSAKTFQVSNGSANYLGTGYDMSAPLDLVNRPSGITTCIAKPLQIVRHPCPKLTVKNCTLGFPQSSNWSWSVTSMNGADNEPMYSRCKASVGGYIDSNQGYNSVLYAWGNIKSFTINVIQPYDYVPGGTCVLTITGKGFTPNLDSNDLNLVINCNNAGKRVIYFDSATGSQSGDVIAAYTGWLSGVIQTIFSFSGGSGGGSPSAYPLVTFEILTDQGITAVDCVQFFDNGGSAHPMRLSGTNLLAYPL